MDPGRDALESEAVGAALRDAPDPRRARQLAERVLAEAPAEAIGAAMIEAMRITGKSFTRADITPSSL